jgi:hypothetical protein
MWKLVGYLARSIDRSFPRQLKPTYNRLNPPHFTMAGKTFVAIIPFDGDVSCVRCFDCSTVGLIAMETNTDADFQLSGLLWGHLILGVHWRIEK